MKKVRIDLSVKDVEEAIEAVDKLLDWWDTKHPVQTADGIEVNIKLY